MERRAVFAFIFVLMTRFLICQVGTLTGTGMSICNLYSFSVCPNQTITPLNYGSQGYACTGTNMPDVSYNIMGASWRVMKNNWFFSATTSGVLRGYSSTGVLQTIPFNATNTITPLSYSGTYVQFAINGVATGTLLSQANYSISLSPVVFGANSYTYCPTSAPNVTISPVVPAQGGPWTYTWQPGNITGNPVTVSPTANTVYTVTAKSTGGCTSATTVSVVVNCPPVALCSGNAGAPVFTEDFGAGTSLYGPPLPPGVTTYTYSTTTAAGFYAIANNSNPFPHNFVVDSDHTGNTNGYMMLINGSFGADEAYRKHVTGLCPNTTYVFSGYLANHNKPSTIVNCNPYIYANVSFQTEYPPGTVLGSVSSGPLPLAANDTYLNWQLYGFSFTTLPGQTSVDVVMRNNAAGGCGNDYVVDDISLSPCGPGVGLSIAQNKTVFCAGEPVTLQSAYTSGGYTNPQYQWQYSSDGGSTWSNIGGATSQNYSITSVSVPQGGMYQLIIAETGNINSPACSILAGPLSFSVTSVPLSVNSPIVCSSQTTTLTAAGASTYTWSNGVSSNSINVSPQVTTNYTVTGTVGTCTGTTVATVSVMPLPTLAVTGSTAICPGQTATLTVNGASTYSWSNASSLSSSLASTVLANPGVTTVYTVTGTSNNSCSATATLTVVVNVLPVITGVTTTSANCGSTNGSVIIAANPASVTYSWSSGGSTTNTAINLAPGAYTATLSNNGCTSQTVITIASQPGPVIMSSAVTDAFCGLSNGSATVTSNSSSNTYSWSSGVTSVTNTAGSLAPGNYTITVVNGTCQTSTVVTILGSVALNITSALVLPSYCNFNNGSITTSDNQVNSTYSWTPVSASTGTITALSPGSYSLTVSNAGCSTSTVFVVPHISGPTAIGFTQTNLFCMRDSGQVIINTVSNGTMPYQYSLNNAAYGAPLSYSGLTTGIYTLTVKDANNCTFSHTLSITRQIDTAEVLVTVTPPTCLMNDAELKIDSVYGGTSPYHFNFNNTVYTDKLLYKPLSPGNYVLDVLDSNYCKTSLFIIVPSSEDDYTLYIPNTFTPNGDAVNDKWYIQGTCIDGVSCTIYNRWGEKIVELNNINDGWDGKYRGADVPDGVYVYVLTVKTSNDELYKTGHITLFR